ncbi:hypothetical protein [Pseudoroseomonas cervicalis]|uniref:hypothetical protein n=1 Tax=Teichococcus cervicalis TaxID=204525 RepID=UPI0022F1B1A9|nr:hypothetical protein [Pseudoroseomonas cervicalis]WBV42397.1 hypothetical protein PFY06_14285 [Pseudoroseomonas cervicalis]
MPLSDLARRLLPALLLLALSACGSVYPFWGNPGGESRRLAQPPAYRIAIAFPAQALLTDAGAERFANSLADSLRVAEVPAVALPTPWPLDWPLRVTAERRGESVVPRYALLDADGAVLGEAEGRPVPLRGWGQEDDALFKEVAQRDAPAVAKLLEQVEAARKASDPRALAGQGPLRIRLAGVRGAPGDGNRSLNERMRDHLNRLGYLPQDQADGATYAVQGVVEAVSQPNNTQRIELQWIVTRRDGFELGRVVQINEVPRGTLNGLWGDVAYVAAEQAANGIQEVIRNAVQPPEAAPGEPPPTLPQAGASPAGAAAGNAAQPAAQPGAGRPGAAPAANRPR